MGNNGTSHRIMNCARPSLLLLGTVLALTTLSAAQTIGHAHKAKRTELNITTPTAIEGTTLSPGTYEVREVRSVDGPALEFVHKFRNELASELVQADEEEIVARVKFSEQILNPPPKDTQLVVNARTGGTDGLEIRGDSVEYVFAVNQMAAQ
jgi:hypothetical protein